MRTFFKILSSFFLLTILVGGVYVIYTYFFTAPLLGTPAAVSKKPSAAAAPSTNATIITPLSQQKVFDYWINSKTNAIYLVTPEGKVIKTFGDGREETVNSQTLPGLHRIEASPDGTKAIAQFNYPFGDTFALYDTETHSWQRLPFGVTTATFDPTGQKVAYVRRANNSGTLSVLNLSDKKTDDVMNFAASDGALRWHAAQEVWLVPPPTARTFSQILIINIIKHTASVADAGAMLTWNTASADGLRLTSVNFAPSLSLIAGRSETVLPFVTVPSKCTVQSTTVYCGVPIELPARSVLPDDYLQEKFFTRDGLATYDTVTRRETQLFEAGDVSVDIDHPIVKGKQLLFMNRYDEKLYAFNLK